MTEAPVKRGSWQRWLYLVGALLVAGLVYSIGWRPLWEALRAARPGPLALMVVLIVAGFWVRAYKWRYALGPGEHAVGLFFLSKLGGAWSPARVGEFAPLLVRPSARNAAWIVFDRIVEVWWTLALGLLGVAWLVPAWNVVWAMAGLTYGLLTLLALVVLARMRIPEGNPEAGGFRGVWGKALRLAATLHGEVQVLRLRLLGVSVLTFVGKLTDIFAVVALCAAFGYDVRFLLVCAARCAHGLLSAVPITPDATGVPYAAQGWLLHAYGGMPLAVITAALALEVLAINLLLYGSFLVGARNLPARPTVKDDNPTHN